MSCEHTSCGSFKYDTNLEAVTLLNANSHYAKVRYPDGPETTESFRRLSSLAEKIHNAREEETPFSSPAKEAGDSNPDEDSRSSHRFL